MELTTSAASAPDGRRAAQRPRVPNPALANLPQIASLDAAFERMEFLPADATAETAVMPTIQHAHLGFDLVRAVFQSASERDLSSLEFRNKTESALEVIFHQSDRHGHSSPAAKVRVPNAVARGFLVVVPEGMGRLAIRRALVRLFGDEVDEINVDSPEGLVCYLRARILVVQFGPTGGLRAFAKGFVKAFDDALGLNLFSKARGRIHRGEDEIGALLQALAIAGSLGCLIVENINTRNARPDKASELWDTLARFADATGIPVVIMVTPGAAAALSEQDSARRALSGAGQYHVPPHPVDSLHWHAEAQFIFNRYLRKHFGTEAPDWYFDVLWKETLGHTDLGHKLCAHMSRNWRDLVTSDVSRDHFSHAAKLALLLEQPHLKAITTARKYGGLLTNTSVRRHGDWLPLELVMKTVPGLEDEKGRRIPYPGDADQEGMPNA
ncbi:hypothetical protein [Paraburkholderia sp. RL18-085-BIA-A]|uniref:hypothetical protein n=1 Tax=Paraburkholderia sp. RL18-085-BIA-A TaxID=3031633 RepID=UPI0038B8D2B8